jgi:hypothetical protein
MEISPNVHKVFNKFVEYEVPQHRKMYNIQAAQDDLEIHLNQDAEKCRTCSCKLKKHIFSNMIVMFTQE